MKKSAAGRCCMLFIKTPFLFIGVCSIALVVTAQTNKFFVTEEPETNGAYVSNAERVARAKEAADSRPAGEDPGGNWGSVCEGFQVSVRLPKVNFTNGEPVIAFVLLRNVSYKPLAYSCSYPIDDGMKVVLRREEVQLPTKDAITPDMPFIEKVKRVHRGSETSPTLAVGVQRRFIVNLNEMFDLTTNGQYTVQISRQVGRTDRAGVTNAISGTAQFRITGKP